MVVTDPNSHARKSKGLISTFNTQRLQNEFKAQGLYLRGTKVEDVCVQSLHRTSQFLFAEVFSTELTVNKTRIRLLRLVSETVYFKTFLPKGMCQVQFSTSTAHSSLVNRLERTPPKH